MEKRVAVIGIVVEKEESAETVNAILHEYRDVIVGRMGIPYRERGLSVISVIVDAPNATISAISGKLGMTDGVTSKAIMQQNEVEENKNMYNPKSGKATEFIDDREILDSLEYAQKNKNNKEVIDAILEKASAMKGISHREAAVLLECELEEENKKIEKLAKEIKQRFLW